ncbi:MAG: hypothetical protein IJ783_11545 [Kiritimatiellae bacterium]|nr:hypothetical protein [Kiritimatiellia bacterium]
MTTIQAPDDYDSSAATVAPPPALVALPWSKGRESVAVAGFGIDYD